MEELSEFLGWATLALFGLVVLLGLLLRFGKLGQAKKSVSLAHRILSVLAAASVLVHFLTVDDKPILLIVLGLLAIGIPLATMALKRVKKLNLAIGGKLVLVPLLAIGLYAGHLAGGEGSENEGRQTHGEAEHDGD